MTHRNNLTHAPPARVRWASLGVVVLALLGLVVAGSRLVQAGSPAAVVPAGPREPVASTTVTNTIFLPWVSYAYPCTIVQDVTITNPPTGTVGTAHTFTARVDPSTATRPVTYSWQATEQAPLVHSAGPSDTVTFTWDVTGTKFVTVSVTNRCGSGASDASSVFVELPWDPRGMIAFERKVPPDSVHDVFVMYHDGTRVENVTNRPDVDDGAPAWSPDGNWIAFSSDRVGNGNRAIFKIDLRTRRVTQLTSGEHEDGWPAWSPDGGRIAFMRSVDNLPPDIYAMDPDGTNVQQLTDWAYKDDFPAWSPDGERIVFSSERHYAGRDLYLMRRDGSDEQIILLTPDQDELYPTWGPGGWIYYTFQVETQPVKKQLLYRIDPETTDREKVFDDEYDRYIASWSPGGGCFVYYSKMGGTAGSDKEIWKWCQGYPGSINLTNNDIDDEFCAWSPVP